MPDQNQQQNPQSPQNPTIAQNEHSQNPFEKLDDIHKLATEMRAKWLPYKMIRNAIFVEYQKKYREDTIRDWFAKGGMCLTAIEYLRQKIKEEKKEQMKEVEERLQLTAIAAVGVIEAAIDGEDVTPEQISQARDVLDRTGYPKTQRLDANGKFESEGLTVVAQGIKAILERRPGVPARTPQQNGQS